MIKMSLLRSLPPVFLFFMILEFILMLKIDEPYPAVILPPFKETSSLDTLKSSRFNLVAYEEGKNAIAVNMEDILGKASHITTFYMLLKIPDEKEITYRNVNPSEVNRGLKNFLLSRRKAILKKSDSGYVEMKNRLNFNIKQLSGMKADSIMILKKEIFYTPGDSAPHSSVSVLKTIRF